MLRPHPSASSSLRRRHRALGAAAVAASLVLAACGGSGGESGSGGGGGGDDTDAGTPTPGGKVVYALEAETTSGWCLPEGSLAISGIQVARAVYDTLTVPDENADYQPYLAETLEPNEDYTVWTMKLRDGVTFHDGTALDATVVKNNLDAYRGKYEGRNALLLAFVFQNISDVAVVDPMTVQITTATPWPALPAALFGSGRVGIMAQAQLDDPDHCDTNLIGTGPFVMDEWIVDQSFTATKNPDYWATDADGNALPYLDEIEFRPIADGNTRVNGLLSEEIDITHVGQATDIETLRDEVDSADLNVIESAEYGEVGYQMMNTSIAPFDNKIARQAVVAAVDMDAYNQTQNLGILTNANGPFAPGEIGYEEDTGWPGYDPELAKDLVAQYESETGQPFEFTLLSTPDPGTLKAVQIFQQMFIKAGMDVQLRQVEQATLIDEAIAGNFQMLDWRNHPGGDPDGQYDWWKSGSVVNFSKIDDPEIDRLLDEGRATADRAQRQEIYGQISERFASEQYNLWMQWTLWTIGSQGDVHGVFGPALPDGSAPFEGLATGHSVAGLWVQQ